MRNYYIITFENTYTAMNAEELLKEERIKCIVMPTPTSITKSCGICLGIDENELNSVIDLAKNNTLKYKAIYKKDAAGYERIQI